MEESYKIIQKGNMLAVLKGEKIKADGFWTISDALHAIWVLEGKVAGHFYMVNKDGCVNLLIEEEGLIDE